MISSQPDVSIRTQVPLVIMGGTEVLLTSFNHLSERQEHIALVFKNKADQKAPLVRIHSSCVTGDIFGSHRCDCGHQLKEAIRRMSLEGGVLLYLFQEGRGMGLYNKIDAYKLQIEKGLDTFAANRHLNFPEDGRKYDDAAGMLKALDFQQIRLLTNNPLKISALESSGVKVLKAIPTKTYMTDHNRAYLQAKKDLAGHHLFQDQETPDGHR